jgi:UDP-N-acetylglucosamine--N-acetylmuramyl-(pentapeptide) pyrophosphoryl-undecaprenol N-acetylglucosamine transferase
MIMGGCSVRLLICAGGTGGGVYPALAVLQAVEEDDNITHDSSDDETLVHENNLSSASLKQLLWVGGIDGMEENLVKRAGISFESIPAAGLHGIGFRALPGNLWKLGRGIIASLRILHKFHPDVLFFTGGYVAVPMALAARLPVFGKTRPRSLLYVPDIEPGLALKTLARFADRIAVTSENSKVYFPRKQRVVVTGYPTRRELRRWKLDEAYEALGLSAGVPTMLVLGGSKGARSINRALLKVLPQLLLDLQVIHISGQLDWPEVDNARTRLLETLEPELVDRYRAYPYLHEEMGAALTAADFVLSRAGASALGEYSQFGLPAILVPYPHAWRYQQVNAEYLAKHGAAIVVQDEVLQERIMQIVRELIDKPHQLERMSAAMHSLANPNAAQNIADQMFELASGRGGEQ